MTSDAALAARHARLRKEAFAALAGPVARALTAPDAKTAAEEPPAVRLALAHHAATP